MMMVVVLQPKANASRAHSVSNRVLMSYMF
jgi:hypothetical protein